jgi:hypothetical protein
MSSDLMIPEVLMAMKMVVMIEMVPAMMMVAVVLMMNDFFQ